MGQYDGDIENEKRCFACIVWSCVGCRMELIATHFNGQIRAFTMLGFGVGGATSS